MSEEFICTRVPGQYISFFKESVVYKGSGDQIEFYKPMSFLRKIINDLGVQLKLSSKKYEKKNIQGKVFYLVKVNDQKEIGFLKQFFSKKTDESGVDECQSPKLNQGSSKITDQKIIDRMKKDIQSLRDTKWSSIKEVSAFGEQEELKELLGKTIFRNPNFKSEDRVKVNELKEDLKKVIDSLSIEDTTEEVKKAKKERLETERQDALNYLKRVRNWDPEESKKISDSKGKTQQQLLEVSQDVPSYLLIKEDALTEVQKIELKVFREMKKKKEDIVENYKENQRKIDEECQKAKEALQKKIEELKKTVRQKIEKQNPQIWDPI